MSVGLLKSPIKLSSQDHRLTSLLFLIFWGKGEIIIFFLHWVNSFIWLGNNSFILLVFRLSCFSLGNSSILFYVTSQWLFSESVMCFSNLQISKKIIPNYYPKLEIWIWCLLLLAGNIVGGKFKFQVQDSGLEYSF